MCYFFNILDMLTILWEMIVEKNICYQLVNLRLQSGSIFWYLTYFYSNLIQFWFALTLWQLGLFNSYTKGKRMWLFWTPFLNRGGAFLFVGYRLDIATSAESHVLARNHNKWTFHNFYIILADNSAIHLETSELFNNKWLLWIKN